MRIGLQRVLSDGQRRILRRPATQSFNVRSSSALCYSSEYVAALAALALIGGILFIHAIIFSKPYLLLLTRLRTQ